jgi:hypothetical protein
MTFMDCLMQESGILAHSGKPAGFHPESGIPAYGAGEGARMSKMCQNPSAGGGIWLNSGTTSLLHVKFFLCHYLIELILEQYHNTGRLTTS